MTTLVTLTSRGRITLPKKLRAELGLKPGTRLAFSQLSDGSVIMRVKNRTLSSLGGILAKEGYPAVSVDEMKP
jgi:AbrB family looped-hinge helix DNA binding protein